jgi:TPR repeat protein
LYEFGEGTKENKNEAVEWYRKAADQGNENAKKRLAELQPPQTLGEDKGAGETERALATIPAQFLGEWNDDLKACGTGLSDGRLRVYANRLQFYESTGYVQSLKLINPQTVELELSYTGEGSTWNDKTTLILSGSGRDLKIGDFWRSKC